MHHRQLLFRRRPDPVPDAVDHGPLILVHECVQGLQEPPHRRRDPDRIRTVDLALHRSPGRPVPSGPDRQVEAAFDAQVDRRNPAEILGIVVRDRAVRLQLAAVCPDEFDEVRTADLLLSFREDP